MEEADSITIKSTISKDTEQSELEEKLLSDLLGQRISKILQKERPRLLQCGALSKVTGMVSNMVAPRTPARAFTSSGCPSVNIICHTLSFYLPQILQNHESTVHKVLEEGSLEKLLQLADISQVLISKSVPQSRIEHFKVSEKMPQIVRTLTHAQTT